eukprot:m.213989 g.213989  ORF g.213989 m.213989 type:complete len:910 (+) comp33167_c1_seq1:210-2939(+)
MSNSRNSVDSTYGGFSDESGDEDDVVVQMRPKIERNNANRLSTLSGFGGDFSRTSSLSGFGDSPEDLETYDTQLEQDVLGLALDEDDEDDSDEPVDDEDESSDDDDPVISKTNKPQTTSTTTTSTTLKQPTLRTCDECFMDKPKGWCNPEIDAYAWFCEDCWGEWDDDFADTKSPRLSSSLNEDVVDEDEEEEPIEVQTTPSHPNALRKSATDSEVEDPVLRRNSENKFSIANRTVLYAGNTMATSVTFKAANDAWANIQPIQHMHKASLELSIDLLVISAGDTSTLNYVTAASASIVRAVQITTHEQTVAVFIKDQGAAFMLCHFISTQNSDEAAELVTTLEKLIDAKGKDVRRASMSMTVAGGRRQSFKYARESAVTDPKTHKKAYSFKRIKKQVNKDTEAKTIRRKISANSTTKVDSDGGVDVDLSKPIGMFKCTYLGSALASKGSGTAQTQDAIDKIVETKVESGERPQEGVVVLSLGGCDVVDMSTSEEITTIYVQSISNVSIVDAKKLLAPLKMLMSKNWDKPVVIIVRNKSTVKGKPLLACEAFSVDKLKDAKDIFQLIRGSTAVAASRKKDVSHVFDPDPSEPESAGSTFAETEIAEIPRKELQCVRVLGKGQYGEVYLAKWTKTKQMVAVKLAQGHVSLKDASDFLGEAEIMAPLRHKNILNLIGVAIRKKPWLIVLEMCEYGDLRDVLTNLKSQTPPRSISHLEMVYCAYQIASAMAYISSKRLIHMDLATRNCLVKAQTQIKIADFGVAQHMTPGKDYWLQNVMMKLPGRWMAPESLQRSVYSSRTDVWTFGVTCWEIQAYGDLPYRVEGIQLAKIKDYVVAGNRLKMAPECDPGFYEMILRCWNGKQKQRPKFDELVVELRASGNKWKATKHQPLRDLGLYCVSETNVTPDKVKWAD